LSIDRLERFAFGAEFPVIIIFDNQHASSLGQSVQLQAALRRHRHAQRKLVRGRDTYELRGGRNLFDHHPVRVDRHSANRCTCRDKSGGKRRVTRLFDSDERSTRLDKDLGEKGERLLSTGGDNDFVRRAHDRPHQCGVLDDRLAQTEIPLVALSAPAGRRGALHASQCLRHAPSKFGKRK
jgi:hypothetical protein